MSLQNQVTDRKNEKKIGECGGDFCLHSSRVERGLEFILSHFSEPLFPRTVSTAVTEKKQRKVESKERAMSYFQEAVWEDSRISGFGLDQKTNPDLIFIELDASAFANMRSFKLALIATLKNIEKKIGGHPTVLWSGRGYHIIQPIHSPEPLENIKELADLEPTTSNRFMQFAERYLSMGKSDQSHHPSIRSCMLRVPGSYNSKCKTAGKDPEVRIIQTWNGQRPDFRLLVGSFYAYLVDRYYKEKEQKRQRLSIRNGSSDSLTTSTIPWIEKLLKTPIEDYRKNAVALILAPYLLNIKHLSYDQAYDTIMRWLDACASVRRLEPTATSHEFKTRIKSSLDRALRQGSKPMRWQTLKERNPILCESLKLVSVSTYCR